VIAVPTPAQQRRGQRVTHLLAAAILCAYVYAPLDDQLQDLVRFAVFPVLALTGVAMWQAARVRRTLRSRRGGGSQSIAHRPHGQKGRWPHATPRDG
jgi:hypothetical protein